MRAYDNFQREREIYGLKCILPAPPPINEIANYNLPQKDQRFVPVEIPQDLRMWETTRRKEFEAREWKRRREGYWFFNNGNLEYLTGVNYFYLNYWKFPVVKNGKKVLGLPYFTDADRDFFYFWEECKQDKKSFGMVNASFRRWGKTYKGTCILYEELSRTPESHGGIQSKTDTDGRKVFNKMIKSWQKLPYYFKPIDTGDSHPVTSLRFYESGVKNTKTQFKDYSQVLRSEIDYGTALDEHYDGDGLLIHYSDEVGKTPPKSGNVLERWLVIRECISDGNVVTGKALWTTTVEEMEKKGGRQFYNVWKISDQNKRNILGQTEGGLYRYFNPAYYGYRGDDEGQNFMDEYGYSNKDAALTYHKKKRSTLSGESLLSYRRKYPIYESDLFVIDNKESIYDLDRIYKQMEYNETMPTSTVVRGNFVWEVWGQKVKFVFDESGRWYIVWRPKDEDANRQVIINGKICPGNPNIVSGVDPFDHKFTTDNRKSNAASYVFKKFDPLDPENSSLPVSQYIARPHTPEMFYEDMLMQCVYYGCELLCENNKIGLINYFRVKGFYQYLMRRPESTHTAHSRKEQMEVGIPMSGDEARQALMDAIIGYVYTNVGFDVATNFYGKVFFPELLEDLIAFDPTKWTPHDCTVAFGLSLLATQKKVIKRTAEGTDERWFRTYKTQGNSSYEVKKEIHDQMFKK